MTLADESTELNCSYTPNEGVFFEWKHYPNHATPSAARTIYNNIIPGFVYDETKYEVTDTYLKIKKTNLTTAGTYSLTIFALPNIEVYAAVRVLGES